MSTNPPTLQGPRPDMQAVMADAAAEMIAAAETVRRRSFPNTSVAASSVPSSSTSTNEPPLPPTSSPTETKDSATLTEIEQQRDLRLFGYYFDADGYLRDTETNNRPSESELGNSSGELVACIADYVHYLLVHTYKFQQCLIPTEEEASVPEARAPIFFSDDYDKKDKLLVIIQGSGRGELFITLVLLATVKYLYRRQSEISNLFMDSFPFFFFCCCLFTTTTRFATWNMESYIMYDRWIK